MWLTKRWGTLLLAMTLLLFITACGGGQGDSTAVGDEGTDENNPVPVIDVSLGLEPDAVVAEFEGGTLTAEQFEDYLRVQVFINPQYGLALQQKDPEALKTFVESYVAEKTMASLAPELENVDAEADQWVGQLKDQYLTVYAGDEKKLEKQMKDQGVTDEQLRDFFIQYKEVESYLSSQVTEEEMRQKYEEESAIDSFTIASVRHILIAIGEPATGLPEGEEPRSDEEAKKLAEEIADRLRNGEDFTQLAREYSEDPGSKDTGGLYEDVYVTQWVPEFKKAAVELPLDTISDPVKSDHGYHVMRVEKRSVQTYEEVKDLIRAHFINEKYTEYANNDLKKILKDENIHLPES